MAFTFAGHWGSDSFTNESGRPYGNTAITVYLAGTTTLATLYTSRLKTATGSNPFTTDQYGNGGFYADPGEYDLAALGVTLRVSVPTDPLEPPGSIPAGAELQANKGHPGGYADLDGTGRVPIAELPVGSSATTVAQGNDGRITGAVQSSTKDQANGVAGLDSATKLNPAVLPNVSVTDTFTVGSQAAMLGLTAQRGDLAIRTDFTPPRTYALKADDPTVLGNWQEIVSRQTVTPVEHPFPASWSTLGTMNRRVFAFYYPWFSEPSTDGAGQWYQWAQNGHTPPDDVASKLFPLLGAYSSADRNIVAQHMTWLRQSGVGVIIYSWWGRTSTENTRLPLVLDEANKQGIKVAFIIEPYSGRTAASVANLTNGDIKYLIDTYGTHPAFFTVSRNTKWGATANARPVCMIYLHNSGSASADADWVAVMDPLHASSTYNTIVLGTATDIAAEIDNCHFDGLAQYGGNPDYGASFGTMYTNINALNSIALFSVSPGFDNTRLGGGTTVARYNYGGASNSTTYTYDRMWQQVTKFEIGGAQAEWVAVTSFNEWGESSVIEPAVAKKTGGFTYVDFDDTPGGHPFTYLEKTAQNVRTFLAQNLFTGDTVPTAVAQAFNATPVDQSAALQADIDALYNAGGGKLKLPGNGVFHGSFKMRAHVSIDGSGFDTVLRAMPGQSAPVIDYHTYDAFHTSLSNLRVEGNYWQGAATCRGIDMTSSSSDAFSIPHPNWVAKPVADFGVNVATNTPGTWGDYWDNSNNRITDVMVKDCGGDAGVYIGVNQRNLRTRGLSIESCKAVGFYLLATDSFHEGLDVGNCGDCIVVRGAASKIVDFKAWYAGRDTGYTTGSGDGIRVDINGATRGDCILIGETQDNNRYGWAFVNARGVVARGTTAGDVGCVLLGADGGSGDIRYNDVQLSHSKADLSGPNFGVVFGNSAVYNRVKLSADPDFLGGSWVAVGKVNSGTANSNDVTVGFGQLDGPSSWIDVGTVTGTYTPAPGYAQTTKLNVATAVTIGPPATLGYRRRIKLIIQILSGGSITWDASYQNPPVIPASLGVYEVEFNNYGYTSSASPAWQYNAPVPGGITTTADQAVATTETTTSTTYADLTTVGPAVTVNVPASGKVWVSWGAALWNSGANNPSLVSVALSGANTQTAATTESNIGVLYHQTSIVNGIGENSRGVVFTGLATGSTTFTMKYRTTAGTSSFARRNIVAIPLP